MMYLLCNDNFLKVFPYFSIMKVMLLGKTWYNNIEKFSKQHEIVWNTEQ